MALNNLSVQKAILIGKLAIYVPIFLLFLFPIFFGCFLINQKLLQPLFLPVLFIIGVFFGVLFWCFSITIWKIWAFKKVRNVHELKQKAIWNNLIHDDKNWFNNLEIQTYNQKKELKKLQEKFLIDDVFVTDDFIPEETKVYSSRVQPAIYIGLGVFMLFSGIYFSFFSRKYIKDKFLNIFDENDIFILSILIGIFFTIYFYNQFKNTSPRFIFNCEGFKMDNYAFIKWEEVSNEKIFVRKDALVNLWFYDFFYHNLHYTIPINDLKISFDEFERIMKTYRFCYENPNRLYN